MALVVNSVCRFTVNGTYDGEQVANIIDMQIDTTGGLASRDEGIYAVAGDIINNWDDHVVATSVPEYVFTSVSWVDLNSLDGATGERTSTSDTTLPSAGRDPGNGMPGNVAARVIKRQDGGRRARNGRMYLVGVSESHTSAGEPNRLGTEFVALRQDAMDSFLDGINDREGPNTDITAKMVVVHAAEGAVPSYTDVDALVVEAQLRTQRRRLPR